ncbi:tryptophan halogenase [Pseudoalteromonas luteoviolacea B = ATCC 29581]|nr:tryptophan halogenase [Pseudoalteromonas luteoviolacea B = ATCC 29581]
MTKAIEKVVIVGGGTAGWMTALSLAKYANISPLNITLVQAQDIETIGVGEATIPNFVEFNRNLGIHEAELLRQTNATFKLGIQFQDWKEKNHSFFHPFSDYGLNINNVDFHHYVLSALHHGLDVKLSDFCLSTQLANKEKFYIANELQNPLEDFGYAYHFDAGLYATLLKRNATAQGVAHKIATIEDVKCRVDGFIDHLVAQNGEMISGDLFIDCSGFRGELIEKVLETGYERWDHWLLCDKAVAVHSESECSLKPFTKSTAKANGWQWSIPLQNRMGNGYLYASQWESDQDAQAQLLASLTGSALTTPRVIPFTPGRRKQIWNKNCFAVGLSTGFIEPLESTSISLIQSAIAKLLSFFPDSSFDDALINHVNRLHNLEVERVRDFIILHYKLSQRTDSEFWRHCQTMSIPTSLEDKIALFKASSSIEQRECESFEMASWLSMYFGFDVKPKRFDPRANLMPLDALKHNLGMIKSHINQTCNQAPSHDQFVSSFLSNRKA